MKHAVPRWVRITNSLLVLPFVWVTMPGPVLAASTGRLSPGVQVSDNMTEGYLDLLAPVAASESALLFVNPKISGNDDEEQELNVGAGLRYRLDSPGVILGGNLFYDTRETANNERFDQVGAGFEILSQWIDARGNYYWPEDDQRLVDSYSDTEVRHRSFTEYGNPYATGNAIEQKIYDKYSTTTINRYYEQFEAAMEGYDLELGFRLPVFEHLFETRLLGGYYDFESDFGEGASGFKGRLEVRALPALTLDAVVYENDDLTGSDYYVGARVNLPFDFGNLAKGRNPFAGSADYFRPAPADLTGRMTEMVIRDINIRTEKSDFIENEAARQEKTVTRTTGESTATVMDEITFVNNSNTSGTEDGTAEKPYNVIQEGVTNAFGANQRVYVFAGSSPYLENVQLQDGTMLMGQGCPIIAGGGKRFGGNVAPVVDGRSLGPTFTMANFSTLRGFEIVNSPLGGSVQNTTVGSGTYDISRVGVYANNQTFYYIDCNDVHDTRFGALLGGTNQLVPYLKDNRFHLSEVGVLVDGLGSSNSTGGVISENNRYENNSTFGLKVEIAGYENAGASLTGDLFSNNGASGVSLSLDPLNDVTVLLNNIRAVSNAGSGMLITGNIGGNFIIQSTNVVASHNSAQGLYFSLNSAQGVAATMRGGEAIGNGAEGMFYQATAASSYLIMNNFDFSGNGGAAGLFHNAGVTDTSYAILENIAADNNAGMGIMGAGTAGTNYTMAIDGLSARNNGSSGVYFAPTSGRDVGFGLANAAIQQNGASGVMLGTALGSNLYVIATNSTVSGNGGAGMMLSASSGGDQLIQMKDMDLNDNGAGGLEASLSSGSAIGVQLNQMSFNRNSGNGLTVSAASAGEVAVGGDGIQANDNVDSGVSLSVSAADKILSVMQNVEASRNGQMGILVSQAGGGESVAAVSGGSADDNGQSGVYISSSAASNTLLAVMNFSASDNGDRGVDFSASAGGPITIGITNVVANRNGSIGIRGSASSAGEITLYMKGSEMNENGESGVALNINTATQIVALIENVTADNNSQRGFDLSMSSGASISLYGTELQANGNGFEGFNILSGNAGDQNIYMANANFYGNGRGLNVQASSGGSITASFGDMRLYNNNFEGFKYLAACARTNTLVLDAVVSIYNDGHGLDIMMSGGGVMNAMLTNIDASRNNLNGVNATFSSAGNLAVTLDSVSANLNSNGIQVAATSGGTTTMSINNGTASGNDVDGVKIDSAAAGQHVLNINGILAQGNDGNGLQVNTTGGTGATSYFYNVVSRFNNGSGLVVTNSASSGNSFIFGDTVNVRNNGNTQSLELFAKAPGGSAVISFVNTYYDGFSIATLSGGGGTNYNSILP